MEQRFSKQDTFYGEKGGAGLFLMLDGLGLAYLFQTPTANVTWWYTSFAATQIFLFPLFYSLVKTYGAVALLLYLGAISLGLGEGALLFAFSVLGVYLARVQGFDGMRNWKPLKPRRWRFLTSTPPIFL